MQGNTTLYFPSCERVPIATRAVAERKKAQHDLGRPKFLETILAWADEYRATSLACSRDWADASTGLLSTALSSLEVDDKELTGRNLLDVPGYDRKIEFGVLTPFKYPNEGTNDEFSQIATTRPETMLGDAAIAEFGTGAVTITHAHDPNDFAISKRHGLAFINILNGDDTMNQNAGKFQGHKRFEVRFAVTQELRDLGLFVYYHWMQSVNAWCLSRQLWFGHQCPAYFVRVGDDRCCVAGRTEDEAHKKAEPMFLGRLVTLNRDPEVLDTWSNSRLWPFSTLGRAKDTHDTEKTFPTSVLFHRVARMIFFPIYLTGRVPFKEVYCHSPIRVPEGWKVFKLLGNVVDLIKIMEDRFPARDTSREHLIHSYHRFCNKMNLATKYALGRLGHLTPRLAVTKSGRESVAERWILHKLTLSAKLVKRLTQREFSNSTQNSKAMFEESTEVQEESAKQTLYTAIESGLTIIHPFMPFLTEEFWQRLPRREGDKTLSITTAAYSEWNRLFDESAAEAEYGLLVDASKGIRSSLPTLDDTTHKILTMPTSLPLPLLVGQALREVSDFTILGTSEAAPTGSTVYTVGSVATVFFDIKGHVDIDVKISRAMAKLQEATDVVNNQKEIMPVPDYQDKVSDVVKEGDREKLRAAETEVGNLQYSIEQFEKLKP
ncbi:valyl-tRNA synthetase-like protein [Paraphoma chrysanthemicola]|uniref:valine--tRNA ligase n=1 Tax=Paraphoma chrysanthemicola TaxID=798071 RepID=A0A8K0QT62_9PLEO|nr:valyl-tRNA synthetase-like protein [Paraphoma chrysanthemicola]